jgi:diguanylate cyclase (GGDEF)-like protein
LDIDHFKQVNDRHGHQAGDHVLREFASRLSQSMRLYDILARYGGEEFVILFRGCNKDDALGALQRIRERNAAGRCFFGGTEIIVRFSAGLASFSDFTAFPESADQLVKLADERLYRAKEAGRDRIVAD